MKDPLTRLTEKTSSLGNYNRKYLHIISENIEKLTDTLERYDKRDMVHLWSYSLEIPGEMDTILELTSDYQEKLDFLGCYFALQFLHMNLRLVDIVKLELATSKQRSQTGKKLMLESGRMFRLLTKCYMQRLLNLFLNNEHTDMEYSMLSVGTRADQDDIDLGIIHRNPEDAEVLNRAIGRLASEMFKKANRLHFHLSEHVVENSFTATIDQYEKILDRGQYDFVIVTEMLGAAVILGSYSLFEEFETRITNRFFHDPQKADNRFHEAFLRGILGEINSLLTSRKAPEVINPKDDALRPIKSLLSALKVVHGIHKVNTWNIIDDLKEKNPERRVQYEDIERILSFFELFRHLYQIMVAQDEEIYLQDEGVDSLVAKIAEMIGFEKKGVVEAKDFMLVIYYEFLEKGIKAIEILLDDIKKHLLKISIFRPVFSGDIHKRPGFKGNLAIDFIRTSKLVRGATYWDDFQEEIGQEDNRFFNEFIDSFNQLPDRLFNKVAKGYVAGAEYNPASILRFLVIIGKKARDEKTKRVFNTISSLFLDELGRLPTALYSLTQILYAHPQDLNKFLALIQWQTLQKFVDLVQKKPATPELLAGYKQLLALTNIHYQSSHFFKQHFHKILNKFPIYIKNLRKNDRLREIAEGFYSDLTSLPTTQERLDQLGDYYDLEFVRVSLLAMEGADCERTDYEFIEFCDNYTLSLYEFCQQNVHLSHGYSMHTHDLFALYATGGHAREQGFDDDYDMIVILDSTDQEGIDYCNKIVGKMNSHIIKRGIIPHHRFADHFGSYVISIRQLAEYLDRKDENVFIDQSQILTSRMLVGSRKLDKKFYDEIIFPKVYARKWEYIERVKAEMSSRHEENSTAHKNNIKECRGGLRDIEMLLLMYKAKYEARAPLSRRFLRQVIELEPHHANQLVEIGRHLNFIKNLRDLYRLKVAAQNVIDVEYLGPIAADMGYGDDPDAGDRLYKDCRERSSHTGDLIEELSEKIRPE